MKKTHCILLIGASLLVTLVVESVTFEDQRCLASSMLFTQVKYVVRGERLLISKQARLSRGNPIHFYLGLLSSGERGGGHLSALWIKLRCAFCILHWQTYIQYTHWIYIWLWIFMKSELEYANQILNSRVWFQDKIHSKYLVILIQDEPLSKINIRY